MRLLVAILRTGTMGLPVGVPRPVVKQTTLAPLDTNPDTDGVSKPGESMITKPDRLIRSA